MRPAEIPVRRARKFMKPRAEKCAKNRGLGTFGRQGVPGGGWSRCEPVR